MTSAVTSQPLDLAQRTISTEPAVDRWQMCTREPTCAASSTSRAMIDSSATAGQPPRPSSAETTPSFIWAPSVSRGSWACWATTPSKAFTYSRARRMITASSTHLPSSEKTRHPGGGVGHGAELGELLALQADGDGADGLHVAVAGLPAEPPDLLDDAGGVGDREGVGHGVHGGVAADGGGPGAGQDGLGVLAAGLAQVGVQVDQAGQQDLARRPRRPSAPSARRGPVPTAAMVSPSIRTSCGSPPRTFAPRIRVLLMVVLYSVRSRSVRAVAAGGDGGLGAAEQQVQHGHPDARRRWRPARRRCSGRVGDLGGDLHAAVHRAGVHHDGVLGHRAPSGRRPGRSGGSTRARWGRTRRSSARAARAASSPRRTWRARASRS